MKNENQIIFKLNQVISSNSDSKTNKKIAECIINNQYEVLNLNITDLAKASDSSPAAVNRLCKRLNLKGFSQFKMALAEELYKNEDSKDKQDWATPTFNLPIEANTNIITNNIIDYTTSSLNLLKEMDNQETIDQVVNIINSCNNIILIGTGASGLVCKDLLQKLNRLGFHVSYTEDTDQQILSAYSAKPDDIIIAVSYSGNHKSTITAVSSANEILIELNSNNKIQTKSPIIGITRKTSSKNKLAKLATHCLYVPDVEPIFREGASISRISQLLVVDILYQAIIQSDYEKYQNIISITGNSLKKISK